MPKNKSAAPNKKTKKRAEPEDEEEQVAGDLPEQDDEAEAAATQRKQKKQKKKAAEPEEEEEQAEEPEEDDAGLSAEQKEKKKLKTQREHKKISGYRSKAKECGFIKQNGIIAASGIDMFATGITPADAKRLMRFVPEVLNKSTYDKTECAERMKLSQESVPNSAARETQARCEAVMRWAINQLVLRSVETGKVRADAATMTSILRPFQYNMMFTSAAPPKGLIRHAQSEGILSSNTKDEEGMEQEKADNKELGTAAKALEKEEEKRKDAFRKRRVELAQQRAVAA